MRQNSLPLLVSSDLGLIKHWCKSLHPKSQKWVELRNFEDLLKYACKKEDVVWLDMSLPNIPAWQSSTWQDLIQIRKLRIIAASSNPTDNEAITALDAGCVGYCHAYSDSATLIQVAQVTKAGHIWIGTNLMQQLIQSANRVAKPPAVIANNGWQKTLTTREREIAKFAANGDSNLQIAKSCDISERTVKAHMSAVFDKLDITDRLQLALKVHGII
jgi:DNA-binding NarL/FixJ family response regulator